MLINSYFRCRGKEGESLLSGEGKGSDIESHEFLSSFLFFLSKKAGFVGDASSSTLHVRIATISDMGGL